MRPLLFSFEREAEVTLVDVKKSQEAPLSSWGEAELELKALQMA